MLPQYLDTHEPTNPLGVLMIPAPASLFEKFKATLASLGAASSNSGKFPQLQTAAFSRGSGVFPGKVATTASKDCHSDYEVDRWVAPSRRRRRRPSYTPSQLPHDH
jgi:hypothetical protein